MSAEASRLEPDAKRQRVQSTDSAKPTPRWLVKLKPEPSPSRPHDDARLPTEPPPPSPPGSPPSATLEPLLTAEEMVAHLHPAAEGSLSPSWHLAAQLRLVASSPVTSASTQRRCLGREFGCHAFPSMVLAHLRRSQEALSDQVSRWEQAFSSACDAAIHGKEGDFMYCHSTESILLLHREETEELTLKIGPTKKALRHQLAEMGIAFRIWHPSGRSAEEEAEPMRPAVVAPEIADDLRALVAVPGQLVSLYSSKRLSQSISSKRAKPSTTIVLAGLASIAPFLAHHLQGQLSLIAAQMAVMLDPHHRQPVSPDWLPRIFSPSPFVHGVWVGLSFQASEFWRPGLMAQSTERGHLLSVQPGIPGMPLLPNQIRALVASLKTENPHLLIESKIVPWKESIFGHLLSVDPFPCFVIYRDQILIE